MIRVSNEIAEALAQDSRTFDAKLLVNGTEVSGSVRSLKVYKGSCGAQEFNLGVVFCPYIEAVIDYDGATVDVFENTELKVQIGINLGTLEAPSFSYIDIGYFTVIKPQLQGTLLQVTGYGRLSVRFNDAYMNTSEASLATVLQNIATATGINITTRGELDLTGTVVGLEGWSNLEVLRIIAGLCGGYVTEDNAGGVVLCAYNSYESGNLIVNGKGVSVPDYKAYETAVGEIVIESTKWVVTESSAGNIVITGELSASPAGLAVLYDDDFIRMPTIQAEQTVLDGIMCYPSMTVDDTTVSPMVYGTGAYHYSNEYMTPALFEKMVAGVGGYAYRAGDLEISHGTPILEPWDAVLYIRNGESYIVPCMSIAITYDGGVSVTVQAVGETVEEKTTGFAGALTEKISRSYSKATEAMNMATELGQYFWFTGTDTGAGAGAHITEKPQATVLLNPADSGGNLLARSDGIEVRNGLTNLASFGVNGTQIGQDGENRVIITDEELSQVNKDGTEYLNVLTNGAERTVYGTKKLSGVDAPTIGTLQSEMVIADQELDISDTPAGSIITVKNASGAIMLQIVGSHSAGYIDHITNISFSNYTSQKSNVAFNVTPFTITAGTPSTQEYRATISAYLITNPSSSHLVAVTLTVILRFVYDGAKLTRTAYLNSSTTGTGGGRWRIEASAGAIGTSYPYDTTTPTFMFGTNGGLGAFSASLGEGLEALYDNQVAVGKFNDGGDGTDNDYAFTVGVGEDETSRENALAVTRHGDLEIKVTIPTSPDDAWDEELVDALTALGWEDLI